MEVPTGWVQVLRGPRRPSQKWPMAQPVQRPRQPRVSPVPTGPRAPRALAVMGDTDGVAVECLKAELRKAKKDIECLKFIVRSEKRIAELDRERESEQSALTNAKARPQRLETEQSVPVEEAPAPADWKAQMEALQAQVNSLREERDQAVHSPAVERQAARSFTCQWGHSTNAHSGSGRVGQLDASGAPECDELGRRTSCGGSEHETGRRCFTDGLLDRWNGDVKAVPSVAEAIRHQCGLKGVRVGEADNPGPSRRRRTQRLRAVPWVWDSDSE